MTLRLARWAALGIAFGALLVLLFAAAGGFASEVDPGSEDVAALLPGLDAWEEFPGPALGAPGWCGGVGLWMPRTDVWTPAGRRVVSEIFRPPIS